MKGYEFATALSVEFGKQGTASYPITFLAPDGSRYTAFGIVTDPESKETQVLLEEEA